MTRILNILHTIIASRDCTPSTNPLLGLAHDFIPSPFWVLVKVVFLTVTIWTLSASKSLARLPMLWKRNHIYVFDQCIAHANQEFLSFSTQKKKEEEEARVSFSKLTEVQFQISLLISTKMQNCRIVLALELWILWKISPVFPLKSSQVCICLKVVVLLKLVKIGSFNSWTMVLFLLYSQGNPTHKNFGMKFQKQIIIIIMNRK